MSWSRNIIGKGALTNQFFVDHKKTKREIIDQVHFALKETTELICDKILFNLLLILIIERSHPDPCNRKTKKTID